MAAVLGLSEGYGGGLGLQLLPWSRPPGQLLHPLLQREVWIEDRDYNQLELEAGSRSLPSVGGHWTLMSKPTREHSETNRSAGASGTK